MSPIPTIASNCWGAISSNAPRYAKWYNRKISDITVAGASICEKIKIVAASFFESHSPKIIEWGDMAKTFILENKISITITLLTLGALILLKINNTLTTQNEELATQNKELAAQKTKLIAKIIDCNCSQTNQKNPNSIHQYTGILLK